MRSRWSFRKRSSWALIAAPALALASLSVAAAGPAAAHTTAGQAAAQAAATGAWIRPRRVNNLDCNGWSNKYQALVPSHRMLCVDPHGQYYAGNYWAPGRSGNSKKYWHRFTDNGHYVGHDEPSVKFISGAAGSGNTMTYFMQVPRDPRMRPTNTGSVVDYAQLSPAPWFGLPLCDNFSYPQNPCVPHSDANSGAISDPNAAGSAFMELQFYPPGFAPFADNVSCSRTQWCAAMTIDSLESQFNFANLNPSCTEPVNFAFLQRNGVPAGPPSPQLANAKTYAPNRHTLMINPGDVLRVAITDPLSGPNAGFTATVYDMTTHQKGWMVASARNGFMHTSYKTCAGQPYTFHAEYSTASPQNQVPWAALEGGVLMEQEIGHSEVCASLANRDAVRQPGIIVDKQVYDTCMGGSEGPHRTRGEGGCTAKGICTHPMTQGTTVRQGPIACPSRNLASGQLCEFADGFCMPQGTRRVLLGSTWVTETSPVNFCQDNRFQNGDLDFDGIDYQNNTWPNGSANVPTSVRYVGPFTASGQTYPKVQFETDVAGSEFLCNVQTGSNCAAPPLSAKFYPFWTMTSKRGQTVGYGFFPRGTCTWNFGNVISGVTTYTLGKDTQYGTPDVARFGGTIISAIRPNPELGSGCARLTPPKA